MTGLDWIIVAFAALLATFGFQRGFIVGALSFGGFAIGAFLGWRAVLFSLFAGSLLGSTVGLITLVVGRRVWSAKLPFGPYLAFGALSWMFFGDTFLRWYAGLLNP